MTISIAFHSYSFDCFFCFKLHRVVNEQSELLNATVTLGNVLKQAFLNESNPTSTPP